MSDSKYVDRAGDYLCRVKRPGNGWFGEAGDNQTPFIRIPCFVIEDGDQDGNEIVYQGWLSDKAFDRTIETLVKAFPDWDGDLEALQAGEFTFEGLECQIVAESEQYEGKSRVKAKWLNPAGGGEAKQMDGAKVASLISRLGRKSKAIAKQAAGGAAPAPRPAARAAATPDRPPVQGPAGAVDDDDIPF